MVDGMPSKKAAKELKLFEDGPPLIVVTPPLKSKAPRAPRIPDRNLRLRVVHVHLIEIQSPPKLMLAVQPGRICDVLEIVVAAVVGHEVLSRPDVVVAADAEARPAALKSLVAIGPGNP